MFDKSTLTQLERQLIAWRRQLHRIPEASYKEEKTSQAVAAELQKIGLSVQTFSSHHGVCAVIHGGQPGPVIAFRADMDALSIREEVDSEFRSEHEGAMHACGHDGHMAILLGLASLLHNNRRQLAGTVKLFFQSAEEAAPEALSEETQTPEESPVEEATPAPKKEAETPEEEPAPGEEAEPAAQEPETSEEESVPAAEPAAPEVPEPATPEAASTSEPAPTPEEAPPAQPEEAPAEDKSLEDTLRKLPLDELLQDIRDL